MNLKLQTRYWDDPIARSAFKDFMIQIHGLDFAKWESGGFWDSAYTPFSYFKDGVVVASVCIYLLDAVIDGRTTHVAQLSGVGTIPEMRRKGLNRQLTDIGLEWAENKQEGVFLFADTPAIPFYEAYGFDTCTEYVEVIDAPSVVRRSGAIKLDCVKQHNIDRVFGFATSRSPVSNRFSILNERLVMFHVLYVLKDFVYEIPALNCVVFFERKSGSLHIYDILGEQIPSFSELYPYIADAQDQVIRFHFHTDKLGLEGKRSEVILENNCFVKKPFPVENPVFPFTSRA